MILAEGLTSNDIVSVVLIAGVVLCIISYHFFSTRYESRRCPDCHEIHQDEMRDKD